eukprot:COSAG05_NODE_1648_length_4340_cov_79.370667_3_plen_313_part_00
MSLALVPCVARQTLTRSPKESCDAAGAHCRFQPYRPPVAERCFATYHSACTQADISWADVGASRYAGPVLSHCLPPRIIHTDGTGLTHRVCCCCFAPAQIRLQPHGRRPVHAGQRERRHLRHRWRPLRLHPRLCWSYRDMHRCRHRRMRGKRFACLLVRSFYLFVSVKFCVSSLFTRNVSRNATFLLSTYLTYRDFVCRDRRRSTRPPATPMRRASAWRRGEGWGPAAARARRRGAALARTPAAHIRRACRAIAPAAPTRPPAPVQATRPAWRRGPACTSPTSPLSKRAATRRTSRSARRWTCRCSTATGTL